MSCSQANTSYSIKLRFFESEFGTKKVIVHHLITFIHGASDLLETRNSGSSNWKKLKNTFFVAKQYEKNKKLLKLCVHVDV